MPLNIQLFLWCIGVHHFCQLPRVFDPLLSVIFSQGRVPRHKQASRVGTRPSPLMHALYELPPGNVMSHSAESLSWVTLQAHVRTVHNLPWVATFFHSSSLQEGMAVNLPLLCNMPQMLYFLLPPTLLLFCRIGVLPYFQGTHVLYSITATT